LAKKSILILVLVLKKFGGLGLGLGLETQSLGLGLGLDKSLIYITAVQSVPAVTKDIFVWIVGSRRSANYFNCAV